MRTFIDLLLLFWGIYCLYIVWRKVKHIKTQSTTRSQENHITEILDTDKKGKEDLVHCLDMVNSWIENSDQKASIILSIVGVAMTILMTSDFIVKLHRTIFVLFFGYWEGHSDIEFDFARLVMFLLLIITIAFLAKSSYMIFQVISPNIDYKKMYELNPTLVPQSYIFFGSISAMDYNTFKNDDSRYIDDLKSQIYINSKIALVKFNNFKEGLYWFKITFLFSSLFFLSIMFL